MGMLQSVGLGLLMTFGLIYARDLAMPCDSCLQPDRGAGLSILVLGLVLVPAGWIVAKVVRRGPPKL